MRKTFLAIPDTSLFDDGYSYYPTEEKYVEAIIDVFYHKDEHTEVFDDRVEFYHDFFAYQEGWTA